MNLYSIHNKLGFLHMGTLKFALTHDVMIWHDQMQNMLESKLRRKIEIQTVYQKSWEITYID